MKTLSIKQPYASLIVEGIKDIENRTTRTHYRGKIYVHASATWHNRLKTDSLFTREQFSNLLNKNSETDFNIDRYSSQFPFKDKLIVSAIIGEVEIIDCVINHPSIWADKTPIKGKTVDGDTLYHGKPIYNWVLSNPILYEKPILNVKGKLSLWEFKP